MKTIQQAIDEKLAQIAKLQIQVEALREFVSKDGPEGKQTVSIGRRGRKRGRRAGGESRADQIEAYLTKHSGPQPAKEIASALGMKPAEVHGAVNAGLKTGRFSRGSVRATYALASEKKSPVAPKAKSKRKTRRTKKTAAKVRTRAKKGSRTAEAEAPPATA